MKILFLCGSLERGRDGVGDYTRRLAEEINGGGNRAFVVAINDHFVQEDSQSTGCGGGEEVKVCRIPATYSWNRRMKIIQQWINEVDPDWISLQYVPFAYQTKGLPFLLPEKLKKVSPGVRWHIMFHELWVGNRPIKLAVLAQLQKLLIRRMIHKIKPEIIHTHLPRYHKNLSNLSADVQQLPLFSNFADNLKERTHDTRIMRVAFFNLVSHDSRIFAFLLELHTRCIAENLEFEILLIGGAYEALNEFGNRLEEIHSLKSKIRYSGFLNDDKISQVLKSCSLGVSPLRLSALGKSGTMAAFLSHGIPVAVPITDHEGDPFFDSQVMEALVFKPHLRKIELASCAARRLKDNFSVEIIARKFLKDLK